MLEVQGYYQYPKMLDNDKKRPPLLDISNKHLHSKKQKQECSEEGDSVSRAFSLLPFAAQHQQLRNDQLVFLDHDVTLPLLSKLNNITREISLSTSPPSLNLAASLPTSSYIPFSFSRIITKEAPQQPVCSISCIPTETLMCILSFLPECADALNARLVCSGWDKLLREKCVRRTVYRSDFLRQSEECYRVTNNYMKPHFQKDINPNMRAILVDWLVEVADEFQFHPETIFLCVNYLDRYLSVVQVPRGKLQQLGIVCLLIAAKFEEIQVPRVEEFVFLSDNTCTREEIFGMEIHVLAKLRYFLSAVTQRSFLTKYLTAIKVSAPEKLAIDTLSNFFIELSLLDHGMLKYPPSLIAAAALCLALQTLHFSAWTHTLEFFTQYSIVDKEMQACVAELHAQFVQCPLSEFKAVYKKYHERNVFSAFPKPSLTLPRLSNPTFTTPPCTITLQ